MLKRFVFILSSFFLLISCYGSDERTVAITLKLSLQSGELTDVDTGGGAGSKDALLSLDKYFAVGLLRVSNSSLSDGTYPITIDYESAKNGVYYFEQTLYVRLNERFRISFEGYYYKDDSTVGGFTSGGDKEVVVREGTTQAMVVESLDLPVCEITMNLKDQSIEKIIFFDRNKGIYLRTINKMAVSKNFYVRIPEGVYDIFGFDAQGKSILLKEQVKVSGNSMILDL